MQLPDANATPYFADITGYTTSARSIKLFKLHAGWPIQSSLGDETLKKG